MQKNPTAILVVAAALIDQQGRVLMHQRRHGEAEGGLWEFPGGKVDPAETPESALVRELAEELGITVDPADLAWLACAELPGNPYVLNLYTCRRWQGAPCCLVGAGLAWTHAEALPDLPMPPLDVPLAKALQKVI